MNNNLNIPEPKKPEQIPPQEPVNDPNAELPLEDGDNPPPFLPHSPNKLPGKNIPVKHHVS